MIRNRTRVPAAGVLARRLVWASLLALVVPGDTAGAPKEQNLPDSDGWIGAHTEHFTLVSNAGKARTRKIAIQLERFRQALGRMTRGFELDSRVPTTTFVFRNDDAYRPYKLNEHGEPMSVSGYFLSMPFGNSITLDAAAGSQPMRVVYHEYFHAVMDATLGDLPPWLNEGLAEYFSTFRDPGNSTVVEVGHPIEDHLRFLATHGTIPWEEVFATTKYSPTYNEGARQGAFYAQSWLIVHYLNATDERSKQLSRYLNLLRSGVGAEEAGAAAFEMDRAALGQAVEAYSKTGSNYVRWDFGEAAAEVQVEIHDIAPAELLLALGGLLAQRGQYETAAKHLEAARAEGGDAAEIETALGTAALVSERDELAEAHLRKAIEAGARSPAAYVLLGDQLMRRFYDDPASREYHQATPQPVLEARQLMQGALARDSENFEALVGLSSTYLFGPDDPRPGIEALGRAKMLRPLEPELFRVQSLLLARSGKTAEALAVIEREIATRDADLAQQARDAAFGATWATLVEKIQADDREAAGAILDEALVGFRDARQIDQLRRLRDSLAAGAPIVVAEAQDAQTEEIAALNQAVERFNAANRLASQNDHDEALAIFEALAAECVAPELCEKARANAKELRALIEHNAFVRAFNEAVDLANAGDRKRSVDKLRELEATLEDPEKLAAVQQLLRQLGARVKKKSP